MHNQSNKTNTCKYTSNDLMKFSIESCCTLTIQNTNNHKASNLENEDEQDTCCGEKCLIYNGEMKEKRPIRGDWNV